MTATESFDDSEVDVEAAGGIVTDHRGRVVIVYRPHRDDWSLPKGHPDPGESSLDAALREVWEETGMCAVVTAEPVETRYLDRRGRRKRVRYYPMVRTSGGFVPNEEVSRLLWISEPMTDLLTYPVDRDLMARYWRTAQRER
ncbi:MAG: NUDIX domain-containing protein [Microthrixaceae bacterium]